MFKRYQLRSYNFRLVILLVATTIFGIVLINSADSSFTMKQCLGLILSLAAMVVVSFIDYKWMMKFYWLMYFVNIGLLLAVKFFGKSSHGAKRWIDLRIFQLQPSELTKIILILFTAKLIFLYKDKLNTWKFLAVLAILLAIPLALILTQPNLSTTILIVMILLTIIFCAGLSYKIIGISLLILVPLVVCGTIYISNPNQKLLEDYQRKRIMAFLQPEKYDDTAWQQEMSEKAIGSGQLSGKGLNNDDPSSLNNANYIPEAQTDFIFTIIGEELGFVGSTVAIVLLMWITFECVLAAIKAKDFMARLICCGVAAWIAFQSFINVGVATRLLPNTGLPLPFFSYGLTSLVSLYIAMGIILNISMKRNIQQDEEIYSLDFKG